MAEGASGQLRLELDPFWGRGRVWVVSGQETKLSDSYVHERYTEWHGGTQSSLLNTQFCLLEMNIPRETKRQGPILGPREHDLWMVALVEGLGGRLQGKGKWILMPVQSGTPKEL